MKSNFGLQEFWQHVRTFRKKLKELKVTQNIIEDTVMVIHKTLRVITLTLLSFSAVDC